MSRWTDRRHFTLYPRRLRERLPRIKVPLEADGFVPLDIQAALEQVYHEGRYAWRVRYEDPCDPPLNEGDQKWANACWQAYRKQYPDALPARI